jgi:hypothetical protein
MLSIVFDATDVLISLTVISAAEEAIASVTRRELLAEIAVGVLIHFLISFTTAIVVVIPTTTTTSVSTVTITAAAAATAVAAAAASRVD